MAVIHTYNQSIKDMKKIFILLSLLLVVAGAQAQLLWKVSGKDLAKPSYIVGTYHLAPASFADSIPGLADALASAEQVYGELDMSELQDMSKVMKMQQALMMPEGKTFTSLFTAEQLARINAFMKELMGVDMSNPMVSAQMEKVKPLALSTQFEALMCMKMRPGFDPQNLFDGYFQKKAAEQGKTVGGLETIEFQVDVLYGRKSLERQAEELLCLIDHKDFNEQNLRLLLDAFFAQDLEGISKAANAKFGNNCDSTPEEENALIYDRNAAWAKALPAIMSGKSTFLAVGAAHLPGERGLLRLLKDAGYEVTPVK